MILWLLVVASVVVCVWGIWSRRAVFARRSSILTTISDASFVWLMLLLAMENKSVLWAAAAVVLLVATGVYGRLLERREAAQAQPAATR